MPLQFDEIDAIVAWLIDGAPGCDGGEQLVSRLCQRLVVAGLPLARLSLSIKTLHPDVAGVTTRWRPDENIQSNVASFTADLEGRKAAHSTNAILPDAADPWEAGFAAGAGDRNHGAAPDGDDPSRHLCRQPRRRADPRGPDSTRPHRGDERRHLAVRHARLHGIVGLAAGGNDRGCPQSLLRLPGPRHSCARRRGPQVHGRWPALDLSDRRIRARQGSGMHACACCGARLPGGCSCAYISP